MRKITALFMISAICGVSALAAPKANGLKVNEENGFQYKAFSNCIVNQLENAYEVESTAFNAGLVFSGQWDLSAYASLRFTIENLDQVHPIFICCDMLDSRCQKPHFTGRTNKAVKGLFEGVREVREGEKTVVELRLPPEMPNPEVDAKFSLMRGTPYSKALDLYSYDIDLSDIKEIALAVVKTIPGVKYVISDIQFVPGNRKVPAVMKLDEASFYPFVDKYGQYKHAEWPGKIHSDKDLAKAKAAEEKDLAAHPGPSDWDQYGGWLGGPQFEASGQFRVEKIDGKWWMIDPEGHLFWSHGVVRVTPSCCVTPLDGRKDYFEYLPSDESDPFYKYYHTYDRLLRPYYTARNIKETYDFSSANAYRKYGEDYMAIYADLSHRRCRSWGLNTMANSSDPDICAMDRTVYNERVDLGAPVPGYPEWPVLEGTGGWWPFIDPFDNLFPLCVRAHLEAKKDQLDDSWCLGFYVDNEISWGSQANYASLALKASPSQASKIVLVDALAHKYHKIEALNEAWGSEFDSWSALVANRRKLPDNAKSDLEELTLLIIDKYFATVREVFKQVAPDKMYLGCRFSSSPLYVVKIAAKYVDVMSYNNYTYDRASFRLPEGIDLPVMLGEFHFGAMDRGLFHPGQVTANSQESRGAAYEYYVKSCVQNPCIIGINWHQFSDQPCTGRFDGENFQVGFTDCCDTPYPETVKHLRSIGYSMYDIRYNNR